ncbi:lysophospholipase L2 [Vibrio variabilis]|uniref:Lysophospholipase L2 n=1 Tax=Vibrio variabilis TaxID=990271 RepID=A0ABQ0JB30_9VIBR|nr:lysophospholipase L2 [Vibrio variabilis]
MLEAFLKRAPSKALTELSTMLIKHEESYRQTQRFLASPPDDVEIYEISPDRTLHSSVIGSTKKQLDSDYMHGVRLGRLFVESVGRKLDIPYKPYKRYKIQTSEFSSKTFHSEQIEATWASRTSGQFAGEAGVNIEWINVNPNHHQRAIVLVQGRNETFWKYQELIHELSQYFSIYTYDHRGQGESERLAEESELGISMILAVMWKT